MYCKEKLWFTLPALNDLSRQSGIFCIAAIKFVGDSFERETYRFGGADSASACLGVKITTFPLQCLMENFLSMSEAFRLTDK